MEKLAVLLLITASAVLLPGAAAAAQRTVHVVDDDRRQCAEAEHTSIQAAVEAAAAGDQVRVCPGLYVERVVVDQPLSITGQRDAVESVDCFAEAASRLDDLDPTSFAIVQGPPDTSPPQQEPEPLIRLEADGVELAGLVLQGAPAGTLENLYTAALQTSQRHSGYRVHHNLIRHNTLGIELGTSGEERSRVDHNCLRENHWHLANQRLEATNARVDHNSTTRNTYLAYEIGWSVAPMRDVTFDHNTSRGEAWPYFVENTRDVTLSHNTIEAASGPGIGVLGGNTGLRIVANTITGGTGLGLQFRRPSALVPTVTRAVAQGNTITDNLIGVGIVPGATDGAEGTRLQLVENVISDNTGPGLQMQVGNSGNEVIGNLVERNGAAGIALRGAVGNLVEDNRMLGNAPDARDLAPVGANTWRGNRCVTSEPASLCDAP